MQQSEVDAILKKPHEFVNGVYRELTKDPPRDYPKAKYAAPDVPESKQPYQTASVANPEEEKALGAGWYDHPNQIPKKEAEKRGPGRPPKAE